MLLGSEETGFYRPSWRLPVGVSVRALWFSCKRYILRFSYYGVIRRAKLSVNLSSTVLIVS